MERLTSTRLRVRALRVRARRREIIRDIDLEAESSDVIVLVGSNGAGKTTLLRSLAGLRRFEGSLELRSERGEIPLAGRIATVLDHSCFYPRWSVAANIAYVANDRHAPRHPTVMRMLSDDLLRTRVARLSAGQRKLAMLAVAFASDSSVLLLDECMNDLDLAHRLLVREVIADEAARRSRIVIATGHETDVFDGVATRVVALQDGRLSELSEQYRLSGSVRQAYAGALG